jgi:hypothetical protein
MTTYGILIMCFMAVGNGEQRWERGRETKAYDSSDILFYPDAVALPAIRMPLNDCKYLEDPIKAKKRMEVEMEEMNKITEANMAELRAAAIQWQQRGGK